MDLNIILSNFFSFLGIICIIISVYSNTKKKMLIFQNLESIFCMLSLFFVGGFVGIVNDISNIIRNTITIKIENSNINKTDNVNNHNKNKTKTLHIFIIVYIIIVNIINFILFFNSNIDLIPIIFNTIYTLVLGFVPKEMKNSLKITKCFFGVNLLGMSLYNLLLNNYVGFLSHSFMALNAFIAVLSNKKVKNC